MVRQVVSQETSDKCREILTSVVMAEKGTGKNARQAGYTIGGKTGTSETTVPGEVVVSFMGFAPADDPQILVLLAYNTPARSAEGSSIGTTGTWISGGNMGAPMAGKLIGEILDYLGVEKEYTADEAALADLQTPKVTGMTPADAEAALEKKGLDSRTVGEGETVTAQVPAAGSVIPGESTVILYLGGAEPEETGTVPDVTGMSFAAARSKLESAGFFMRAAGAALGDSRVQQLLGVLAQIAAAGYDLIIVELGGFRVLTGGHRFFQLVHQCGVAVVGSGNGIVKQILLFTHSAKVALDAPEPCVGDGKGAVELLCQRFGIAVLPAVIFHGRKAPFHTVLEAADGVEVAHLVVQFPQHGAGLVKAQEYLPRQRQKKRRQAKTDLPLQGHPAPHAPILLLCDILPRIFRLIRPVRRQSERSINFLFRPIL